MSIENIRRSLAQASKHFAEYPEEALSADKAAVAVLENGLRCRTEGQNGVVLLTDMPVPLGGDGSAPTPGWLLRAALANCDATVIAMRAAQLGIVLRRLEVCVESQSDHRGILGCERSVPAGPLGIRVRVRIAADGATSKQLDEVVHWAESHSPVTDALRRSVSCATEVSVE